MKNFFKEFKSFLNRGNAIELAVGVIVGGAFSSIVNSLVNDIIAPIIGRIVGGFDFSEIKIHLGGESYIMIGSFIQNIINFVIIAFCLFLVVKSMNKIESLKKKDEVITVKEDPEDIKLLKSINEELKKINNKH